MCKGVQLCTANGNIGGLCHRIKAGRQVVQLRNRHSLQEVGDPRQDTEADEAEADLGVTQLSTNR